jgi:SAM-dependent methyltransferase
VEYTKGDGSSGYDQHAERYWTFRETSDLGVAEVRAWAVGLPRGGAVLDLGCGSGVPISRALISDGFVVHGVDASPRMVAAFRERFPGVPVACEAVESSTFFDRAFDGVVSWGLLFLLPAETQVALLSRMASVLRPGGRLLFTAPAQVCEWEDALTGARSRSLGRAVYRTLLRDAGLLPLGEQSDGGDNHYYAAVRGSGSVGNGQA